MTNNSSHINGAQGSVSLGDGLVEISALTSLIGSDTAAVLALGNRGASGLVWGSITPFGNSSVIKACAGAAIPGWLRHMLGLRTKAADVAIGMDLPLSRSTFAQSIRSISLHGPIGISCNSNELSTQNPKTGSTSHSHRDIFAFDRTTSVMLEELASAPAEDALPIYSYHSYDCFAFHDTRFQSLTLAVSLLKFVEIYYLSVNSVFMMALLSTLPYTFSLFMAIIVEVKDIMSSRRPMSTDGDMDLIVGSLPTMKQPGGRRKVVLGALRSSRYTIWWRIYWMITAILQMSSLFVYYLLLGQEKTRLVITWACFQIAWVSLRTIIFHLADTEPITYRRMTKHEHDNVTPAMWLRTLNLVTAAGTQQMQLHPRGKIVYKDDTFSAIKISKLLQASNVHKSYQLPQGVQNGSHIRLNIVAIIGDTLLSSAAWMAGSELSPMDLYDSCIVVLSDQTSHPSSRVIVIPAARVFSLSVISDSESVEPTFVPRGGGHNHYSTKDARLEWIYWIPCHGQSASEGWMQVRSTQQTVLGQTVSAEVMSDNKLTTILNAGNLNISLKNADDVKEVVGVSSKATSCLLSFLNSDKITAPR